LRTNSVPTRGAFFVTLTSPLSRYCGPQYKLDKVLHRN
jgi:hypothetical protein